MEKLNDWIKINPNGDNLPKDQGIYQTASFIDGVEHINPNLSDVSILKLLHKNGVCDTHFRLYDNPLINE